MPRIIPPLAVVVVAALIVAFAGGRVDWEGTAEVSQPRIAPAGQATAPIAAGAVEQRLEVPPPPFSEGIYPCSGCHAGMTPDPSRRALTAMHEDVVLRHDEEHRWCLDCHDATDRDWLHLASGERVPFEESYRLCGQCHGEKYRDWRAGVHGRRTGEWNGHKKYLLCAHCHNPHRPRFEAIAPMPAPHPPRRANATVRAGETR